MIAQRKNLKETESDSMYLALLQLNQDDGFQAMATRNHQHFL